MKCAVITFGCKANQADSDHLLDALAVRGHEMVARPAEADLIFVNSCTVTRRTDHDVRKTVRQLHRSHPAARIIVIGCYAHRDSAALAGIEGVSLVIGNDHREDIPHLLDSLEEAPVTARHSWPDKEPLQHLAVAWRQRVRPFIKVQDGCNSRCSYCIIPHVRGSSRSVPPERIISGLQQLVRRGAREAVLTGIHLGNYGRDLAPSVSLSGLVERIMAETALERLRLSSIEPMEFDSRLLDLLATSERLAPHLHIPLQSGSATVLRRMNRPYSPEQFAALIGNVARARPHLALGTDIIVGFPGESEAEFAETRRLLEELPFTYCHVFPFSARPGTPAARMPDVPSPQTVKSRSALLREISRRKSLHFRKSLVGRPVWALSVHSVGDPPTTTLMTEHYLNVRVTGPALARNQSVSLIITQVSADGACRGVLVGDKAPVGSGEEES